MLSLKSLISDIDRFELRLLWFVTIEMDNDKFINLVPIATLQQVFVGHEIAICRQKWKNVATELNTSSK